MANETKQPEHTRGPWSYFHDSCVQCERDGTAEYIISGPPGGFHGQFSHEPDALLIAAAPDLLAALQWFSNPDNWLEEQLCEGTHFSAEWRPGFDPREIARQAIAKAIGIPLRSLDQ